MSRTGTVERVFESLGGDLIDPATVLPAALPLDLCGESVRARLCVFTDHNNKDMALRPDLTLPVALEEIKRRKSGNGNGTHVHRYSARAFRQPLVASEPMEFLQIGFERFGAPVSAESDADTYLLVSEASEAAGARRGVAQFGDLGIVPAFIEALALPESVTSGLRRAFRQAGGMGAYLQRASQPRSDFVTSLTGLERQDVEDRLAELLCAEGLTHFGNRRQEEVVTRLMAQAREGADGRVPAQARAVLEDLLVLNCHPNEAAGKLQAIAGDAGLESVHPKIDALGTCFARIAKDAPRFLEGARFSPAFGRRFTYYDGLVFELGEPGERLSRPFAAGGRYDSLLSDLSLGEVAASAIGGVVRPDRLALAASAEGAGA